MSARPLTHARRTRALAFAVGACTVTTLLALGMGPEGVSWSWLVDPDARMATLSLRGMRVALALCVGAALSTSGAALQALLQNPLADPFIIGVSGGAAIAGALGLALGIVGAGLSLSVATSIGALLTSLLLAWFVATDARSRSERAVLVGAVCNAFAWALVSVVRAVMPASRSQALSVWLVGTIGYPSTSELIVAVTTTTFGVAVLWQLSGALSLLRLGAPEAQRLGVHVPRVRIGVYLAASVLVGVAVSTTGVIGFVGLLVPHALRTLVDPDERLLVPLSAWWGAVVVVGCDALVRVGFAAFDTELPVGAVTALVGAPVFAFVLLRKRGRA